MAECDTEEELDLSGLLCPLPVFKARKRLEAMAAGKILKVIATDPMSAMDMAHFCNEQGHEFLEQWQEAKTLIFRIKRR